MITTILSNYLVAGHTRLKIPLHTGYTTLDGHNHATGRGLFLWPWPAGSQRSEGHSPLSQRTVFLTRAATPTLPTTDGGIIDFLVRLAESIEYHPS